MKEYNSFEELAAAFSYSPEDGRVSRKQEEINRLKADDRLGKSCDCAPRHLDEQSAPIPQ